MGHGGVTDEELAFSERTAARLSGVRARRLHEWADKGIVAPSLVRRISPRNTVRLYTFTDLVDLLVVAEMRRQNATTLHIRKMLEHVRKRGVDAPLRELLWAVDNGDLFWREGPDMPWAGGRKQPDQTLLPRVLDLEALRTRAREAAKQRHGSPGQVVRQRRTRGRAPVFEGTRIPVSAVQAYIARGVPEREILSAYPLLKPEDIRKARSLMRAA